MTSNIEFTYNGKVYQSAHGSERYGCTGCAFAGASCMDIVYLAQEQTGKDCFCSETLIWQEKPADSTESSQQAEMTWTLEEIDEACAVISESDFQNVKVELLNMKRKQDPEYQKYLELKAKFGELA